ncbi:MAG: hypothetical protein AAF629_25175 [Chloroflexota bacterium]
MSNQPNNPEVHFKKSQLADTVAFAIENIPTVDKATMVKFLQLVNTTGTFGEMSTEQVVKKMLLTIKYIPNACPYSMKVLAELLELDVPNLPHHPRLEVSSTLEELDTGPKPIRRLNGPSMQN